MIAKIRRFLTVRRKLQSDTIDALRREVIRQSIRAVKAEDRAAYKESIANKWHERAEKAEAELAAIKRQRSDIVRRGNITKRLKREAAKVSA